MITSGVITGVDHHLEWMLPWWWKHYSKHSSYPVVFADFGMSKAAKAFCKERGTLLPIKGSLLKTKASPQQWEQIYGKVIWQSRSAWFKKPLALLASPFDYGLWLDIDCKVQKPLDPLFHSLHLGYEILIATNPHVSPALEQGEVHYNSGVIAFCKKAPILQQWIEIALSHSDKLPGDEECLSRAVTLYKPRLLQLAQIFNWLHDFETSNPDTVICHYCGINGKLKAINELKESLSVQK